MRLLFDSTSEGGGGDNTHIETIVLNVVSPKQDFAAQGGIHDALVALRQLDEYYTALNNKFKGGFHFGGAGSSVIPTGEIKLTIAGSAIHAALAPGEKIRLNLTGADFQVVSGTPTGGSGGGAGAPPIVPFAPSGSPSSSGSDYALIQRLSREGKVLRSRYSGGTLGAGILDVIGDGSSGNPASAYLTEKPIATKIQEIERLYNQEVVNARKAYTASIGTQTSGMPKPVRDRIEREADAERHRRVAAAATTVVETTSARAGFEKVTQKFQGIEASEMQKYTQATVAGAVANDRFNESTRLIGKNMLQNIKHVTTWAASVGVLYGSIRLLTRSLEENMEIAKQQAILSQIFKGSSEAVQNLTNDVLHLAAANGQSASEAMQSAVEWSRIFHTEQEVIQATNASLIEANVSGEEAAKTTEFLSMMVQVYGLRASELTKVIGEMAAISQTANISNLDLMKGMEAVGEAAKEAGMSWSQTMGVITGGVSATKQSGTTIANTLKTMITQMANPEIQQKLRLGSGVEVSGTGGELKGMTQILGEMFVAWEKMTEAERRSLLFNVGGRQNATRMAGILDEFILGQVKAINAQLNLNAAEQENQKIVETLKGQVAALAAEWDRFVNIQGHGPIMALTDMTKALKGLIEIANAPGISTIATLLGAAGVATGARMMITGFQRNASATMDSGTKGGIVVSTIRALKNDAAALGEVFNSAAQSGIFFGTVAARSAAQVGTMSFAVKSLRVGLAGLTDVVLPLLAIWGGIKGFNILMDAVSDQGPRDARNRSINQSSSRIQAQIDRAGLLQTAADAIRDPGTSQQRRRVLAGQIAGAQLVGASSNAVADLEKQNQLLVDQGRISELLTNLAKSREDAERQSTLERFRATSTMQVQIDDEKRAMEFMRERHSLFDSWALGYRNFAESGHDAYDRHRQRLEDLTKQMGDLNAEEQRNLGSNNYISTLIRSQSFGAAQGVAFSGIGAIAGGLPTATPLDERNRRVAQLMAQQVYLNRASEMMAGSAFTSLPPDRQLAIREKLQQDLSANAAELAAMQAEGGAYAGAQTRLDAYGRFGRARFGGMAIGLTGGEQMAEQQRRGMAFMDRATEEAATAGMTPSLAAESLQVQIGLMQNKAAAQEKILELIREEINLNIQARREYERSLLTSSPAELLRKMAVAGLTRGRGISGPNAITGGEFFSMSQEAREEFMRMPGNTEGERMARRGRVALEHQFGRLTPYEYGEQSVRGTIPTSRYSAMIPNMAPQIAISPETIAGIISLGTEAGKAAAALTALTNAATAVALDPPSGNSLGSVNAPPSVAQAPSSVLTYQQFGPAH